MTQLSPNRLNLEKMMLSDLRYIDHRESQHKKQRSKKNLKVLEIKLQVHLVHWPGGIACVQEARVLIPLVKQTLNLHLKKKSVHFDSKKHNIRSFHQAYWSSYWYCFRKKNGVMVVLKFWRDRQGSVTKRGAEDLINWSTAIWSKIVYKEKLRWGC